MERSWLRHCNEDKMLLCEGTRRATSQTKSLANGRLVPLLFLLLTGRLTRLPKAAKKWIVPHLDYIRQDSRLKVTRAANIRISRLVNFQSASVRICDQPHLHKTTRSRGEECSFGMMGRQLITSRPNGHIKISPPGEANPSRIRLADGFAHD